jgi:hypothetical protein
MHVPSHATLTMGFASSRMSICEPSLLLVLNWGSSVLPPVVLKTHCSLAL